MSPPITKYFSCGTYQPYRVCGVDNPHRNELTFKMMDLKNPSCAGHQKAVAYFADLWLQTLSGVAINGKPLVDLAHQLNIAIIPRHEKDKVAPGLLNLAKIVYKELTQSKSTFPIVLRRKITIASAHNGGDRSVYIHQQSIEVVPRTLRLGLPTLLLDDVKTTGASMNACKNLLESAGSGIVIPCPLLETA
ncbi:hypothetical protein I6M39_06290 [Shewanella algae]|uniref:hypothetical protein n=1 Tax=Shewanella algae TaxID=38313 RepID=UPI001183ACA3|nr:hypothetical protein [Shewanella algae]MBO2568609.1 hypothetical protein [Shewanella algae]